MNGLYYGVVQVADQCSTPEPPTRPMDWVPDTPETVPAAASLQGQTEGPEPTPELEVIPDSPLAEEVRPTPPYREQDSSAQ